MTTVTHPDDLGHETTRHTEHGQDWLTCLCGAAWSIVDCGYCEDQGELDYEDYEEVSHGDGECEVDL